MMAESGAVPQINANAEAPRGEQRPDRGPRNGEPRNRGERNERGNRGERGERTDRGEGRTDARPEGGRGDGRAEGRNERPQRQDNNQRPANDENQRQNVPAAQASVPVPDNVLASGEAAQGMVEPMAQNEGSGNREKRPRDRYGRDRGDRGPRGPREEAPAQAEAAIPATDVTAVERTAAPARPAPVATAATQTPVQAAPAARQLPRVQPFTLPLTELSQVAEGSGLQWVNSDATKVATVQAAIAAEPKQVHVPRARPAPIVIDEGPLVLVETRRDLRELPLPMEQTSSSL